MKLFKNISHGMFLLILCAFFCVGCDNSMSTGDVFGVKFVGDEASRSLTISDTAKYDPDSLYWAFTAQKIDGLYTSGESAKAGLIGDDGSNGKTAGGYALRPVKDGPASGLGLCSRKFSYGDWVFKIYGYKSYDGLTGRFKDLMYTGSTIESSVKVTDVSTSTPAEVPVIFKLEPFADSWDEEKGVLLWDPIYYTVPENIKFYKDSKIIVSITDVTDSGSPKGIMTASVTFTDGEKLTGTRIPLPFVYASGFDGMVSITNTVSREESRLYKVSVSYTKSTTVTEDKDVAVLAERTFPIIFRAGVVTVLSGDVCDVVVSDGVSPVENAGVYVAKILKKDKDATSTSENDWGWFTNLQDAVAVYGTAEYKNSGATTCNHIRLLRNIDYAGTVSVPSGGYGGQNLGIDTCGYFIRNMTVAVGDENHNVVLLGKNGGHYNFYNGTDVEFFGEYSDGSSVKKEYIKTNGGKLDVYSSNNAYHNGTIDTLLVDDSIADSKATGIGYHLGADVSTVLTIKRGYVDLGSGVDIRKLDVQASAANAVVLTGTPSTVVENMAEIRDCEFIEGMPVLTANSKTAFKKITLKANGGSYSRITGTSTKSRETGTERNLYGIEGMYMDLPLFVDSSRNPISKDMVLFEKMDCAFTYWIDSISGAQYRDYEKRAFVVPSNTLSLTANWLYGVLCITAEEVNTDVYTRLTWHSDDLGSDYRRIWNNGKVRANLVYSVDLGRTWHPYTASVVNSATSFTPGESIRLQNVGDKVFFKAKENWMSGNNTGAGQGSESLYGTKKHTASGSMRGYQYVDPDHEFTVNHPCAGAFCKDTNLTVAPSIRVESYDRKYCMLYWTFEGCTNLKRAVVTLNSVTPRADGDDRVTYFGNGCFSNCSSLEYVEFNSVGWNMDGNIFINCGTSVSGSKYFVAPAAIITSPPDTRIPSGYTIIKY